VRHDGDWRALEERVARYLAANGYRVQRNVKVVGRMGAPHEIDVLGERSDGVTTYSVLVECKWWQSRIEKDVVAKLGMILLDVGANKGIIVSKEGSRSGAVAAARDAGIELWGPHEIRERLGAEALAGGPVAASEIGEALAPRITEERGRRTIEKAARGVFGIGGSELAAATLAWLPVHELQVAITRTSGLRQRPSVTRIWPFYESLSGRLVQNADRPLDTTEQSLAPVVVRELWRPAKTTAALRKATDAWKRATGDTARARRAADLGALGVATPLVDLEVEKTRELYFPFYVGVLMRRDAQQLIGVSAIIGNRIPVMDLALSASAQHVLSAITPSEDRLGPSQPPAERFAHDQLEHEDAAEPGVCSCGGTLVLRHRRSDGQPFYGCDRFPVCRKTQPA